MRRITLITTGGTIEKTYDEVTGELINRRSIVRRMLEELRLEGCEVNILELMSKDSLVMTGADRSRIVEVIRAIGGDGEDPAGDGFGGDGSQLAGIVILHGTDTLTQTGEKILREIPHPRVPVVLTGAIRPYEMKRSDALQNLNESIFAVGILEPGVYCVAHGQALRFPGVEKDRERGTFIAAS